MTTPRRRLSAIALLAAALAGACAHTAPRPERAESAAPDSPSLTDLARWMTGHFTSTAQSAADPDYLDIHLRMVPIWTSRPDGPWLYVEQATAAALGRPYRQRIYNLSRLPDGRYQSAVYELPGAPQDALRFAGAWRDPARFDALAPADLRPRAGCEVLLTWDPAARTFSGGTSGASCPSTLRGATHATSDITLTDGLLVSWDRGFDASNTQVWGAVKGGYRFVRAGP